MQQAAAERQLALEAAKLAQDQLAKLKSNNNASTSSNDVMRMEKLR